LIDVFTFCLDEKSNKKVLRQFALLVSSPKPFGDLLFLDSEIKRTPRRGGSNSFSFYAFFNWLTLACQIPRPMVLRKIDVIRNVIVFHDKCSL
jgi:hypothetical protein